MFRFLLLPGLALLAADPVPPDGWPMFGGTPGRNMANLAARGIPAEFDPAKDCRWKADLGTRTYTQPVVAGGCVLIGTNNERPRNPRDTSKDADGVVEPLDRGILMCLDEATGKLRWQAVFKHAPFAGIGHWPKQGSTSTPAVDGNRVYVVNIRGAVVCLDLAGFADGNQGLQTEEYRTPTDADILWEYDMTRELKVFPHNYPGCAPLVVGDRVFICTGNGVDEGHFNIPEPNAPSFIALDKHTGRLLWKDNSPGRDILHGQLASPAYTADPVPQVIFPGGDGWIRAFDPTTGALLWKFDGNPKDAVYELGGDGTKLDYLTAPVIVNGRLYLAHGQDPEHTDGSGRLWCLVVKKAVTGGSTRADRDVSPDLLVERRPKVVTRPNPASAAVWRHGGTGPRRGSDFGRSLSTACVVGDVLYVCDLPGVVHCLDARTGRRYWRYDTKAPVWNAAYYADGKVFVGNDNGDLYVWRHAATPDVIDDTAPDGTEERAARAFRRARRREVEEKYLLARIELDDRIRTAPAVANGVLYVASDRTLYAIRGR